MADGQSGEKTEQATGKRLSEARDKGQVAKSQEVTGAILLITGISVLVLSSAHFAKTLGQNSIYLFSQSASLTPGNPYNLRVLMAGNMKVFAEAMAPLLLAVILAAVGANVIQVGFHPSTKSLEFKTDSFNVLEGMKKFFKKTAFFEIGKNLLKISVIGLLSYWTIHSLLGSLLSSSLLPLPGIVALGKSSFVKLMIRLLAFASLLGAGDWIWQKRQHAENLKMTKQEIKEERKDVEGDPQIRARIKGMQYEMSRKRMLADVPTADVVVTNPTHFAVALKYNPGAAAPMVVAKGADTLAAKIKEIARKSHVPIMENKPLARSLYRQVEVGQTIPDSLFQAVAEVLAYVYRLKKS